MSETIKVLYGVPFQGSVSKGFLEILEKHDVRDLDTGSSYPGSEQAIGDAGLPGEYKIHTKTAGYRKGTQGYQGVLDSAAQSLKRLGVEQVETYILHTPDPGNPIFETLDAIQKLYKEGHFKHFGVSNFLPDQVQEVYDYCSSRGYVLPTVYEGHYNPIGRHAESELIPLLRELKISFNAYAALAGGFLTKTPDYFINPTDMRWNKSTGLGQMYQSLYNRPKLIEGLRTWNEISDKSGIPKAALSFRWVAYNSILSPQYCDGVIIGATKPEQLEQTLKWLQDGPLEKSVATQIEGLWESVKDEAAFDNFNG